MKILLIIIFALLFIPANLSSQEWKKVNEVDIPIPPSEHPRLYLRKIHIDDLKYRLDHPKLKPVWESLQQEAKKNDQIKIEVNAIKYLVTGDRKIGLQTLELALKTLQKAEFDPKIQDVTRPIGRMMVTGSIAYDWCYPLLTEAQKKAFAEELFRLAKQLECGYPPKMGWVTGHGSEWMVMRDMMSAGLALYDEHPEMYQHAAVTFFSYLLPARNWWYPGHAFHQGTSYSETRFSSDLYPLWIFDRLGFGNVYNPAQQFVPYQWIYIRRPDNQLLRAGDGNSREPKLRSLLSSSYYKDGYVLSDYLKNPGIDPYHKFFELLWSDPDLKPLPLSDLPLSRYMGSPYGYMVARTGWDENSVIAEMKINVYNFNNHQHSDAGAFQIYYKGPLAIDAGLYNGSSGGYGSPHNKNYSWRTIAHNSLLVYDPNEQFSQRGDYGNDGGQRLPNNRREPGTLEILLNPENGYRTGEILAHGFGPDISKPDYTYLKGDITKAYGPKVKEAQRTFVFLNLKNNDVPAALIVFDKVVSSVPEFKKYWLMHSMDEPIISENTATMALNQRGWTGKIINTTLLPSTGNADLASIGGRGKEFWVFGKNYENNPRGNDPGNELGEWRIEVSPKNPASEDYFLNVMQIMDKDKKGKMVAGLEGETTTGVQISDRIVLFSKNSEPVKNSFSITVNGSNTYKILVTDLMPGTWQVKKDGNVLIGAILVHDDDGLIYFEGQPGKYEFLR